MGQEDASKKDRGACKKVADASKEKVTVPGGSHVSKRNFEAKDSSSSKKMVPTKDFSRNTMKISAVTRAQLNIPFGDTDRVVYCIVTRNTHSAAFCVGHALFDMLGHRNFTIADHYIKDTVLVAFKDYFDVLIAAGNDIRCGPEALMTIRRVSRIEQCIPDWDSYFQRNIIIAPEATQDEDVDNEEDEVVFPKGDYDSFGGGFSGGSGGDGDAGGGVGASVAAA